MTEPQKHERDLRRSARAMGLLLRKSRSRTPEHYHYGTYQLVDESGVLVAGDQNSGFGLTLEDVRATLFARR